MRYSVVRSVPGRLRANLEGKVPENCAVALEETLAAAPYVTKCTVYPKVGSIAVWYAATDGFTQQQAYDQVLLLLKSIDREQLELCKPQPSAFAHNASTIALSAANKRAYLPAPHAPKK